jgi:hypothetical protein
MSAPADSGDQSGSAKSFGCSSRAAPLEIEEFCEEELMPGR